MGFVEIGFVITVCTSVQDSVAHVTTPDVQLEIYVFCDIFVR
jgi:hypothetical protein